MNHLALYREWRPQTFDEVVSQTQVVYPLKQSILSGEIAHAYLFAGTRGTGKTTLAKIFARAVNCLNPQEGNPCNDCEICRGILNGSLLDVVEMDAASNNSVDNIRRITDEVIFTPARAKYKVYIIDEVHMLSSGAFNALLKTLEEPPAHAIFILATTELHRIPATIMSRCQRYEFRRIPPTEIVSRLEAIAAEEGIDVAPDALESIARLADGALRDAISLLDQLRTGSSERITRRDVLNVTGQLQEDFILDFAQQLLTGNLAPILSGIDEMHRTGRDMKRLPGDLAQSLRDVLVVQLTGANTDLLRTPPERQELIFELARLINHAALIELIRDLSELGATLKWAGDPRTAVETGLIAMMDKLIKAGTLKNHDLPPLVVRPEVTSPKIVAPVTVAPIPVNPITAPVAPSVTEPMPPKEAQVSELQTPVQLPEAEPKPVKPSPPPAPKPLPVPDYHNNQFAPGPDDFEAFGMEDLVPPPQDFETTIPETPPVTSDFSFPTEQAPVAEAVKAAPATPPLEFPSTQSSGSRELDAAARLIWQKTLDSLRSIFRIDLVMLLGPAHVAWTEHGFLVSYEADHEVHYRTVSRGENRTVIMQQLKVNGAAPAVVDFVLAQSAEKSNLNPSEPEWIRRVREAAQKLKLPLDTDSE